MGNFNTLGSSRNISIAFILFLTGDAMASCVGSIDFMMTTTSEDTLTTIRVGEEGRTFLLDSSSASKFTVSKPNLYYKLIEIEVKKGEEDGNVKLVYFPQWPCDIVESVPIYIGHQTPSNAAIKAMFDDQNWDNKDLRIATSNFNRAYSLAMWRKSKYPNGKSQYNVISSYLALRAFNHIAKLSESSLGMPDSMQELHRWHISLLSRVSASGLEVIWNESSILGTNPSIKGLLYTKAWRKIKSQTNPQVRLEAMQRMYESIKNESETDEILHSAGLSIEMLIDAGNNFARKLSLSDELNEEQFNLINKQIRISGGFISDINVPASSSNNKSLGQVSERLQSDHSYLKNRMSYLGLLRSASRMHDESL